MRAREYPSKELLDEYFFEKDNRLYWRKLPKRSKFHSGSMAGRIKRGYYVIKLFGSEYLAHRCMYIMRGGHIPDDMLLDHINGNKLDNSPENHRLVTHYQNNHNRAVQKRSVSGVSGVTWHSKSQAWDVRVMVEGVTTNIGRFKCIETAKKKAIELKQKLHGEYSGLDRNEKIA